jgi:hypothetical protein
MSINKRFFRLTNTASYLAIGFVPYAIASCLSVFSSITIQPALITTLSLASAAYLGPIIYYELKARMLSSQNKQEAVISDSNDENIILKFIKAFFNILFPEEASALNRYSILKGALTSFFLVGLYSLSSTFIFMSSSVISALLIQPANLIVLPIVTMFMFNDLHSLTKKAIDLYKSPESNIRHDLLSHIELVGFMSLVAVLFNQYVTPDLLMIYSILYTCMATARIDNFEWSNDISITKNLTKLLLIDDFSYFNPSLGTSYDSLKFLVSLLLSVYTPVVSKIAVNLQTVAATKLARGAANIIVPILPSINPIKQITDGVNYFTNKTSQK